MTENFNFHGPTTFVNKPVDTVVQNFQNNYATASGEQLAALLRLVLTSADLPEQDREEAARLVHEAAASTAPATVESKLSKVGRIVARAADIATPAAAIVTSVTSMFT